MAARSSTPVIGALCSTSHPKGMSFDASRESADEGGPFSAHHWALSVGYRHQDSHRHFVGTTEQTQRASLDTEVVNSVNLFDVSLTYKLNPRWSLTISMPILNATRTYDHQLFNVFFHLPNAPDQVSHSNGIGDMSVSAQFWLIRPPSEHGQNIAFSFGTVFPTGDNRATDTVQTVNGPQTIFVDQSIQPGAGGFGISFGTQGYQRIKQAVLYMSGSYLVTPQESNGTPNASLASINRKPNPLTSTISIPRSAPGGRGYRLPGPEDQGTSRQNGPSL